MGRGRKPENDLSFRDKKIVKRYNSTLDTMPLLAKRYGVSKQRIHEILKRAKKLGYQVRKKKTWMGHHHLYECEVCDKIFTFAQKENLITKRQLADLLDISVESCNAHLNQLRRSGSIPKVFATFRSDRLVNALRYYRNNLLSPAAVGKKFGYKNFSSILNYQKKKGLNVEKIRQSAAMQEGLQVEQVLIFPPYHQAEIL